VGSPWCSTHLPHSTHFSRLSKKVDCCAVLSYSDLNTRNMSKDSTIWAIMEGEASPPADHVALFTTSKRLLHRMALGLLPSFVRRKIRPGAPKIQRLHPTSYLDGLRGVASFIVFMGHYTEENLGWYTEPYGLYEDGAPSSPLQLPFIRVIYSARPMVHIFLIISGFVLTYKPLKQIHSQQYGALSNTISSSIFRRALRLFLPSFATLFIMAIAVFYGISDTRYAEPTFELSCQIKHVWGTCWKLIAAAWAINDLSYPAPAYNPALWTIPVEFAQSLFLFVVTIGLSRCVVHIRLFLLAGVMSFCFYSGQLYTVEFLGGMLIAELTLVQDRSLLASPTASPVLPKFELPENDQVHDCGTSIKNKLIRIFWFANVVSGLFIASWTNSHVDEVWGLRFLAAHTPAPYEGQRIWFCLGAFQIVGACTQLPCLQRIFNTSVAQYLGSISYALYLTHNLSLSFLEPRFIPVLDQFFSKTTMWGRQLAWSVGLVVYIPVIIFVADLFWRLVDIPVVKFAKWFESKCIVEKKS
jgi:peptidoglycan/LPS O-acetylase OafA/YrhL